LPRTKVHLPRRAGTLLAIAAAVLVTLLTGATAAQAHTGLASSNPADGGTVTTPLDAIELRFTGSIGLREVTVTGPDGDSVTSGPAVASGSLVTAPVDLAAAGVHTVAYVVAAADGHALDGSLSFTYQPPMSAAPSAAASATPPPTTSAAPATGVPSEAASTSSSDDDGLPVWVIPALGAVLLVAGLAVLLIRRTDRPR
jgi:copper resistance protein C